MILDITVIIYGIQDIEVTIIINTTILDILATEYSTTTELMTLDTTVIEYGIQDIDLIQILTRAHITVTETGIIILQLTHDITAMEFIIQEIITTKIHRIDTTVIEVGIITV